MTDTELWQSDLNNTKSRLDQLTQQGVSKARARAGASGIRKGTQAWDNLVNKATNAYATDYAALKVQMAEFKQATSSTQPAKTTSKVAFGAASSPGGEGASASSEPGTGYSEPTTEFGKAMESGAKSAAIGMLSELSSMANDVALGKAAQAGLNIGAKGLTAASIGLAGWGGHTVSSALSADDKHSFSQNFLDFVDLEDPIGTAFNFAAITLGVYQPYKAAKAAWNDYQDEVAFEEATQGLLGADANPDTSAEDQQNAVNDFNDAMGTLEGWDEDAANGWNDWGGGEGGGDEGSGSGHGEAVGGVGNDSDPDTGSYA